MRTSPRERLRDLIESSRVPRVATEETTRGEIQAAVRAVPQDRPHGVFGAGRVEAAAVTEQRRDEAHILHVVSRSAPTEHLEDAEAQYYIRRGEALRLALVGNPEEALLELAGLWSPQTPAVEMMSDVAWVHLLSGAPEQALTMLSVAETFGRTALGVIMTVMGSDGLQGMTAIRDAGGITIGQDEATSAVYGMPRCCAENGVLRKVVPLPQLPRYILQAVRYRVRP